MADSKTLKLLVVEDNLEDEQLLCEALIEIEEHRQWCSWRTASIVHVEQLSDALDCLSRNRFDAILLNLSLPDSPALLDTFVEVNAVADGTPIVVLADQDDENLANRLLREGAQDILVKSELECAPLARSLRYAIERQRRTSAPVGPSLVDELTGAATREGFLNIAEHYRNLARYCSTGLMFAAIEIQGLRETTPASRDLSELLLIQAGDLLRAVFPAPALIGRLEKWRFGLIVAGSSEMTIVNRLGRIAAQVEAAVNRGLHQAVTVSSSAVELDPERDLEQLIAADELDAAELVPSKTAMLAD